MKLKEAALLGGILLAAFALRMATFKYYLMEYDPFHHYAIAKHIAETGEFPQPWNLSGYPNGVTISEPMGLYYVSVLLFRVAGLLPGLLFLDAFKLATPLFGALTLIPAYLLTKHMFGERTGLYAAAILAILPAFAYRTFAGFYRGDAFSTFFMVIGFYLFMLYLSSNRISVAFMAGICLGAMGLVWNGFMFGFVVLSGFVVLCSMANYVTGKNSRNLFLGYAIAAGLGISVIKYSTSIQPHALDFVTDLAKYVYPSTLLLAGIMTALNTRTSRLEAKHRLIALLFMVASFATIAIAIFPQLMERLAGSYGYAAAANPLFQTIAELQPPTRNDLWIKYYIVSLLFLPGLYFLKNKRHETSTFMVIWLVASLFLLNSALRFAFLASIPIAILTALFLANIKLPKFKKGSQLAALLLLFATSAQGITFSSNMTPRMSEGVYEALNFLKGEESGAVLSWWEYGSWVQGVAGFPTLVDSVTGQAMGRMQEIGNFFLETNESKALDIVQKYRVKYVLVPIEMIGQMTNVYSILGVQGQQYLYAPYQGTGQQGDILVDVYGDFSVYDVEGEKFVTHRDRSGLHGVKRVYWRNAEKLVSKEYEESTLPFVDGAVYVSQNDLRHALLAENFILYIPPGLQDTLLTSLMLLDGKGFPSYELIYSNPEVKIYAAPSG